MSSCPDSPPHFDSILESLCEVRSGRCWSVGLLALLLVFFAVGCEDPECPSNDMAHIEATALDPPLDFMIDRYEASRQDGDLACSIQGETPWTGVTLSQASKACKAAGKRLCTRNEWIQACKSLRPNAAYPYSGAYQPEACNGTDAGVGGVQPTGARPTCETAQGVFDMSGNVKEWVNGTDGEADGLGGGSFADGRIDLRCENILVPQGAPGTGFGFRCCK